MNQASKSVCIVFYIISLTVFAQNLTIANGASLNILNNTKFHVNGLDFIPNNNFEINGPNTLSMSLSAIDPQSISRVFEVTNLISDFQGTLTFFYNDSDLNGVTESELTLQLKDDSEEWNDYDSVLDTNANSLSYDFASPTTFNAVTASGNGVTLSANSFNILELEIFPNPVTTGVNIAAKSDINVSVYNAMGQIILSTKEKQIDLSEFSTGIYIFKIKDESKQVSYTYKVIKN